MVGSGGLQSEVGPGHRFTELLARMAGRVGRRIMPSQGIIRVRACDEGGSVIVEGGRALLGGTAQLRKFRNLAG